MSRIETREKVLLFLYQSFFRNEDTDGKIDVFLDDNNIDEESEKDYFLKTSKGVVDTREELDLKISSFLKKWTIERIPMIDRCILELATYEIINDEEIPVSVSINEAVKLAKKYGTEDSSSYINGVLSSLEKSL